jgi:hypothetical protein
MEALRNASMLIGPLALIAALAAAVIYYLSHRKAPGRTKPASVLRYLAMALGAGAAGYLLGALLGIWAACSPRDAGNLCGLVGLFGVGPLVAAVAIGLYAHSWAKNTSSAP